MTGYNIQMHLNALGHGFSDREKSAKSSNDRVKTVQSILLLFALKKCVI